MLESSLTWAVGGGVFGACFYTVLLFRRPSVAADVLATLLGLVIYTMLGALIGGLANLIF